MTIKFVLGLSFVHHCVTIYQMFRLRYYITQLLLTYVILVSLFR